MNVQMIYIDIRNKIKKIFKIYMKLTNNYKLFYKKNKYLFIFFYIFSRVEIFPSSCGIIFFNI